MNTVLKKELKGYFTSLSTYVYYGLFLFMAGVYFNKNCLTEYSTEFGYYVLSKSFLAFVLMVPLFTMHLLAQEKKNKTEQLLFTVPVSVTEVLLGKFAATAIVLYAPVCLSIAYPIYIAQCGEMSLRFLAAGYLAVVLTGLVILAMGMFFSALTSNTILAAILTYGAYVIVLLGRIVENLVPSEMFYQVLHKLSVYNIFYGMISGIIRSGDVLYLLMLVVLFLVFTRLAVEKKRMPTTGVLLRVMILLVGCTAVTGVGFRFTKVYDFTAEKLLTFSDETRDVVSGIKKETDIYYLGERSRVNATYYEFLAEYTHMNPNIHVHYKDVQTDAEFRSRYLANVANVSETSMVVISEDKYVYLDAQDYVTTTQTSKYSYKNTLQLENQITSAINYVNSEDGETIYYLTGHGETQLSTSFSNMLRMNNYELEELNLEANLSAIQANFPEDCKMLFIYAPQTDFSEEEIDALKEYMDEGGAIFVAIDPLNEDLEQLEQFMETYGLQLQSGVVVEGNEQNYVYDTAYYLKPEMEEHVITKELTENNLAVLTMTSKGIFKNGSENGYTAADLLTTSAKAFAKVSDFESLTTKGENDVSGSFSVATLSQKEDAGRILLLTSDVFFQEEVDNESSGGNRTFFLSAVRYLTGREESGIMIPGKEVGNQVALYPSEMQTVTKWMTMVVAPVCVLLLGIVLVMGYRKNTIQQYREKRRGKLEQKNSEQKDIGKA